jgi:hypothetical protein
MKVAIMQPYFLPYIGYWQLLKAVDVFVLYDNIKYTKKGWINRNRFLLNDSDKMFTLPLVSGSDQLNINQRVISYSFDRDAFLRKINGAYQKSHYFGSYMQQIMDRCVAGPGENLYTSIEHSIRVISEALDITTPLLRSSELPFNHMQFKGQDKVLAICESLSATHYINPIGGVELYDKAIFEARGIQLSFLKSRTIEYQQPSKKYVPWLSIIDPMFCAGQPRTKEFLKEYDLV